MSVVAHTSIGHSHVASVQLNNESPVAEISVSARIDYIQRFSKQAVLVIDDDAAVYTQAARQFLINFSSEQSTQETNVAFVSASTKLNDIQMRCRLIEQLFANTLFDPEKSLAVSILNLSKQRKDNINIIVEHAHALSLQIKYELCQLVDVANKTHSKINVVLFGFEQAAKDISLNKTIFKNKLSIVDAKSGQIVPLDKASFSKEALIFNNKFWARVVIIVVLMSGIIGLSWYGLVNYDDFSLSQLSPAAADLTDQSVNILDSTVKEENTIVNESPILINNTVVLANTVDIEAALLGEMTSSKNNASQRASTGDILRALNFNEASEAPKQDILLAVHTTAGDTTKLSTDITALETSNTSTVVDTIVVDTIVIDTTETIATRGVSADNIKIRPLPIVLTPDYYLNGSTGYVIQLVGFTNTSLLSRFVEKYPNLEYFSYQKKMNTQTLVVLTTAIFETKVQANSAIKTLPQDIIDRGVWVKPLALVQSEIKDL